MEVLAEAERYQSTNPSKTTRDFADDALVWRELEKFLDDARKKCKQSKERAEQIACALWARTSAVEDVDDIRTDYCVAKPNMKQVPQLPSRRGDAEAYKLFMNSLGIRDELISGEHEAVHIHWPGMVDYLSSLAEQGLPLPPGTDPSKVYNVYSLHIRKKKDIV